MLVEHFAESEVLDELEHENTNAAEICEQLGLDKQKLMRTVTTHANPYTVIDAERQAVYRTLFPQETKLEDYTQSVIPIRVLEHIHNAKQYFKEFVIWHPEDVKQDPIVLAKVVDSKRSWISAYYPIARWGTSLDEYPAQLKQATAIVRERLTKELTKIVNDATNQLKLAPYAAVTATSPSYYGGNI
jgi:hypothetical protein